MLTWKIKLAIVAVWTLTALGLGFYVAKRSYVQLPPIVKEIDRVVYVDKVVTVEKIVYKSTKKAKKVEESFVNGSLSKRVSLELDSELANEKIGTKVAEKAKEVLNVKYDTYSPTWAISANFSPLESTKDVSIQVARNIWGGLWLEVGVRSSTVTFDPKYSIGVLFTY